MPISESMYSSKSAEWSTPQDFFDKLDAEFHFTLDVCATPENAKCKKFFTREQDGLAQDWSGHVVWCNPPYGKTIGEWCKKAYYHSLGGGTCVMLIHSRTDTKWFHNWVYGKAELRFVKGRLRFGGSNNSAPFPSLVAVYKPAAQPITQKV